MAILAGFGLAAGFHLYRRLSKGIYMWFLKRKVEDAT